MKIHDNHFEDFLKNKKQCDLHPKFDYSIIPESIDNMKNLILYGPPGVGKYTHSLSIIEKFSPSKLKYEKKMTVTFNKATYYFKISDIHFEVDASLLGCNSKLLWNEIFNNIMDVILTRTKKFGIIMFKNFHEIHYELLEVFYSYMQSMFNPAAQLKFILITENISFIPNNILNCSKILSLSRPTKSAYNKICKIKDSQFKIESITNIKSLENNLYLKMGDSNYLLNQIIQIITCKNINDVSFTTLREKIYNIFIFNLNIHQFIWDIFYHVIENNYIKEIYSPKLLIKTNEFLKYYNNNYRSIFHLENYMLYILSLIHELPESQ
jgi:DNA polymerase III delta prime subunit